jgi:serine protease Do
MRLSFVCAAVLGAIVNIAAIGTTMANPMPGASFAELATRVRDSVVTVAAAVIDKDRRVSAAREPDPEGAMGDFALGSPHQRKGDPVRRFSSVGSGFIVDASGLIVTNNHVIEGGDEIYVILRDGTELKVEKVLGRDAKTDLTLLKVTPKGSQKLTAVSFGDSQAIRVGDWVVAVGNPFGLKGTVTAGILSGKSRDINAGPHDEFLQTDAAINRGNSGGPLFNISGEVVGVNTAIFSPSGGSIGIGFAIPSNIAKRVVYELKTFGESRWSFAGLRVQSLSDDVAAGIGLDRQTGAVVALVDKGGPAEQAGIQEGDVILAFGGLTVRNARDLQRAVARTQAGEEAAVELFRGGTRKSLTVKLAVAGAKSRVTPLDRSQQRRQKAAQR